MDPTQISIRPLSPTSDDIEFAYQLAADLGPAWYRLCREGLPTPPSFPPMLFDGVHAQYIIEIAGVRSAIIAFYGLLPQHQVLWFDVAAHPKCPVDAVGYAMNTCMGSVLLELPFRRAYTQFPEYARPPFEMIDGLVGPVENGRLRGAVFHDNFYFDQVIWGYVRPDPPDPYTNED